MSDVIKTGISPGDIPDRVMSRLSCGSIPALRLVTPLEVPVIQKAQNPVYEKCVNKDITIVRLDSPDRTQRGSIPEQVRLMIIYGSSFSCLTAGP